MFFFHNDYNELCHPVVLEKMQKNANLQMDGYGEDTCCTRAADLICKYCSNNDLAVHFLIGGTQTNMTVIAAALRPHQGVLTADSGHIHVHETGAIESTGHKVIPIKAVDGKITADQVEAAVNSHWSDTSHEHIVQPKMVYLSQPTELGTVYKLRELEDISHACKNHGLYLFVDGARLGYAMASHGNDVQLSDLARLCDVFYIGGTKVGAMFGEAVVISNPCLQEDFRYIMKQRGAMLAKGWSLGLQFDALLEDALYWKIAAHANDLADQIRATLHSKGYPMPVISATNQVFAILPVAHCRALEENFTFTPWEQVDDTHMLVRFCTSWASTQQSVDALCAALNNL